MKVGILHSLSGTMAISETSLKDADLFAIDEINKAGGIKVGGKSYKIKAVIEDPASDWPLFAEKARKLITPGQSGHGRRLLDLGEPQVGAAGVRGVQRPALLPRAVRG